MIESTWTNRPWVCISKWVYESLMTGPFHKENKIGADVTGRWSLVFVVFFRAGLSRQQLEMPVSLLCKLWGWPCGWRGGSLPDFTLSPIPSCVRVTLASIWRCFLESKEHLRLMQLLARSIEKIPFSWRIYAAAHRVKSLCPYSHLPKDQLQLLTGYRNRGQEFTWSWVTLEWGVVTSLSLPVCFFGCNFPFPHDRETLLCVSLYWAETDWCRTGKKSVITGRRL